MVKKTASLITLSDSLVLRGLAISAVVMIHVFAYLKGIYTDPTRQYFFVFWDQLGRFCVPLFLLLSGYGLTEKYQLKNIGLIAFYKSRLLKLLPWYLLWSTVSYLLLRYISPWRFPSPYEPSFWEQLLWGQADYQLYFLPVIFQLYFVYPLLLWVMRRWPTVTLALLMVVQLLTFQWYAGVLPVGQLFKVATDRFEYLVMLSWIAYFGLGMWLSLVKPSRRWLGWAVPLSGVLIGYITWSTVVAINGGVDPLLALKFTRWPIMFFAFSACLGLIWLVSSRPVAALVPTALKQLLRWLGQESYLIFLAHTLGLRIIFSVKHQWLPWYLLLIASSVWLATIAISKKYLKS